MHFPLLGSVNLPWFIIAHALWLLLSGLFLLFRQPVLALLAPNKSPSKSTAKSSTSQPKSLEPKAQTESLLGLSSLGLSLAYFTTAYVEVERNQFLYASVPVRIVLGSAATIRSVLDGIVASRSATGATFVDGVVASRDPKAGFSITVLDVGLYDAVGAVALGLWLGKGGFDGRPPVY